MRKTPHLIDGFIPRESRRPLGNTNGASLARAGKSNRRAVGKGASLRAISVQKNDVGIQSEPLRRVSKQEIDASLSQIDDEPEQLKRRGVFRRRAPKKQHSTRKKIIKRVSRLIIIVVLLIGGYIGYRTLQAGSSIFRGNIFGIVQSKPLKMDSNGRTNVLVFGTAGSVEDGDHPGANLTDTLMVLSVDQNKKDAYMVSLPRDLYIEYGQTCPEGYRGKINSMYECYTEGEGDTASEVRGAEALQGKVGTITGLELQYYAHINWAVVVGAIDAIGGVDVHVEGDGSCGMSEYTIIDYNMKIKYTAGLHQMSGADALSFSRARGAAGGCGLGRGDFDRQVNQQKVLKAMREKAASVETLTNLGRVTGLIDALGQNLKTNFDTSEVQTLMSLANSIPSDKIQTIDLKEPTNELIVGDMLAGASIQIPREGMYDYSEIQAFINKSLNSNEVTREAANLVLLNGSHIEGYAKARSEALNKRGFTITAIDNAPEAVYERVEIYDVSGVKSATLSKLEQIYGVKRKTGVAPLSVSADTDIIVIYGPTNSAN
jgi:LCP family protein required for cell wall assembly